MSDFKTPISLKGARPASMKSSAAAWFMQFDPLKAMLD
jgi:hypothetical protein